MGDLSQEYIDMMERACRTTDQAARMALYHQMEHYLVDQAVATPLHYIAKHHMLKPWVRYYPTSLLMGKVLKDVILAPRPVEA